jgi:hypothetical protein
MSFKEEQALRERLKSLQKTIQFLCNTMSNTRDLIDTNPGMAKLMLQEAVDNKTYDYK